MSRYELANIQYSGGKQSVPTATVRVKKPDDSEVTEAAISGNGPVDATFKAIQRALGIHMELVDFSITAVSSGSEAVGQVSVSIKENGATHKGEAFGTDIIVASAQAFLDALNKKVAFDHTVTVHTI